jgi:hypothetical protein
LLIWIDDTTALRAAYQSGSDFFLEYLAGTDAYVMYQLEFARKLAKDFDCIAEARNIFEALLKNQSKNVQVWCQYAQIECDRCNYAEARTIYKRACNTVSEWPEQLHELWLSMEREHGSLQHWFEAYRRIAAKQRDAQHRAFAEMVEQRKQANEKKQQQQRQKKQSRRKQKPERADDDTANDEHQGGSKQCNKRSASQLEHNDTQQPSKRQRTRDSPADPTDCTSSEQHHQQEAAVKTVFTVHIGNLPFGSTEDEVRVLVGTHVPGIQQVRLPLNDKGKIKGFAFVDFDTQQAGITHRHGAHSGAKPYPNCLYLGPASYRGAQTIWLGL